MIRLTRSDRSRNMHRFCSVISGAAWLSDAMQLGNWVTNPARGQAANLVRSVFKNTEHC